MPLPANDSPPMLECEILESKFDFVCNLARVQLLSIPSWQENCSLRPINNEIFGTVQAYQKYYEDNPTGKYILFFEDENIVLSMEEPPTSVQIKVIKDKLQL